MYNAVDKKGRSISTVLLRGDNILRLQDKAAVVSKISSSPGGDVFVCVHTNTSSLALPSTLPRRSVVNLHPHLSSVGSSSLFDSLAYFNAIAASLVQPLPGSCVLFLQVSTPSKGRSWWKEEACGRARRFRCFCDGEGFVIEKAAVLWEDSQQSRSKGSSPPGCGCRAGEAISSARGAGNGEWRAKYILFDGMFSTTSTYSLRLSVSTPSPDTACSTWIRTDRIHPLLLPLLQFAYRLHHLQTLNLHDHRERSKSTAEDSRFADVDGRTEQGASEAFRRLAGVVKDTAPIAKNLSKEGVQGPEYVAMSTPWRPWRKRIVQTRMRSFIFHLPLRLQRCTKL